MNYWLVSIVVVLNIFQQCQSAPVDESKLNIQLETVSTKFMQFNSVNLTFRQKLISPIDRKLIWKNYANDWQFIERIAKLDCIENTMVRVSSRYKKQQIKLAQLQRSLKFRIIN